MPQMNGDHNSDTPQNSSKASFLEIVRYLVIAVLIVVPFRIFIAQPYVVSGSSMDPTFKDGDYLIVDQLSKRFELPERGSVVIIRYPRDPSKFFIKRLIGFPNEKVVIDHGKVSIFNEEIPDGLTLSEPYVFYSKNEVLEFELGSDEYFVLGDNRAGSSDSRIWGTLPQDNIVGKPVVRLLPLNKIQVLPGKPE